MVRASLLLRLPSAGRVVGISLLTLLLVAGCGRPQGESDTSGGESSAASNQPTAGTGSGSSGPMSMESTYEETGLPKRFTLDGKTWEIMQDIDAPANHFVKGTKQADGKPLYHDRDATPPYTALYLRVGEQDRFLQYSPKEAQ